ncbi:uncharacterized protein TRAVEDRAFT_49816 [Trametes versicolor FP-101664 SS1]|uniref:uncharacterized protein n=1 Tax=Trametes versicolor (strain FP-101664) TaxID=717944 RepID=UPI0004622AE9|nr:uncharacterized protein TRAVEDRAFT_49816 [Trametes versicolor FP-101664 SS1]EIW57005.1 hypothetical protein TRAVEDRAFT_49816 [Trametes versicolor FP-101664 SS1]
MSSAASASSVEISAAYEGLRTANTIFVVVATLLLYDVLLCMDKEVQYVWQSPNTSRKLSRVLYTFNRYMPFLYNIMSVGFTVTMSDTTLAFADRHAEHSDTVSPSSCTTLFWLNNVLYVISLLGPASFTTLRVYALSRGNKMLAGLVLLLSMGPFLVNVSTLYQYVPINLHLPGGCSTGINTSTTTYTARKSSCLIVADTLAVVITWWRIHPARRTASQNPRRYSLEQILWKNGNFYFFILVAMNLAYMISVVLSITTDVDESLDVLGFVDPISSIMVSRFLLALYETNANIERGGVTSVASSFTTLDFGEAGRAAASTNVPGFFSSLAGSIRSISDSDQEPYDSESTSQCPNEEEIEPGTES